ncbi:MAG: SCO family protein, partial [Acidobacteriota bacterium]|nr:SCO family protein [Acidobacteriota bacterium]
MKIPATFRGAALLLLAGLAATSAWAQKEPPQSGEASAVGALPPMLRKAGIDQRLNQPLPLEAPFRDEAGRGVTLGHYFGQRPVILALVYYDCPMLCTQVLEGMARDLKPLSFDPGKEFDVVAVSFDARETPAKAAAKKQAIMARYGRPGTEAGWHFLTGEQASIDALTRAAGFRYAWDPQSNQFAHGAAIMIVTPEGRIAQYYYGIEYPPKDLRLGLVEASKNKIGTFTDQILLYCYHYDPATGRYGSVVIGSMRALALATLLGLGGFIVLM